MEKLREEIRADLEAIRQAKVRSAWWSRLIVFILGASMLLNFLVISNYYRAAAQPVIVYKQETLPVVTKQVRRGERIGYAVDFCKTREVEGTVLRTLVYEDGSQIVDERSSATAQAPGCRNITVYSYEVPSNAKLGKARLLVATLYDTGGLEPQTYRKFTDWVEIVE